MADKDDLVRLVGEVRTYLEYHTRHMRLAVDPSPYALVRDLHRAWTGCRKCQLHMSRTRQVFGAGPVPAPVAFVGEGPGEVEDAQGVPFVGPAGRLLTELLGRLGVNRASVYITNVIRCRPPGNRTPEPQEVEACLPLLEQELQLVSPKVIVALGRVAANALLGTDEPLGVLRGRIHRWKGIPLVVTYHPAYVLRNPAGYDKTLADLMEAFKILRELT